MKLFASFCLSAVIFLVSACCGRMYLQDNLSESLQNSVWNISISRNGTVLFRGLLVLGKVTDGNIQDHAPHISLIDFTGITLVRMSIRNGMIEVRDALPPFDGRRIQGYLISDLELFVYLAGLDNNGSDHNLPCQAEELADCQQGTGPARCFRSAAAVLDPWMAKILYHGDGDGKVREVIIERCRSGMKMEIVRVSHGWS